MDTAAVNPIDAMIGEDFWVLARRETAALLVLKKKVAEIWGDEDDDTTPRSGA